jgi:hypothetical protein
LRKSGFAGQDFGVDVVSFSMAGAGSGRSGGLVLAMAAAVGGVATAVDGPPPVPLFVVAG